MGSRGLSTLVKLAKTRLDEQRQILATLQDQLDRIENEIVGLETRRLLEQDAVDKNPEISYTYGDFLRSYIVKSRDLAKKRDAAAAAVEIARGRLSALFEEQKRYEIAEANRRAEELREELRRETAELDETGSVGFQRNKNNN